MKKLLWVLLPSLMVCLLIYFIATVNVHTGSSSTYFYSAFEQPQSVWECERLNLTATVLEHDECNLVRVEDGNFGETYLLIALDDFWVELHHWSQETAIPERVQMLDEMLDEALYRTRIKHKRWFKTVYAFEILGVDKDCWYKPGNSTIRFRRVEN